MTPSLQAHARNAWCDCIRGYAILLVCIAHVLSVEPMHESGATMTRYFKGDTGVFMFYVLSGFLVTGILARETFTEARLGYRLRAIGNFFGRRILRLQPTYLLFLLLYWMLPKKDDALSWWVLIFPLSNWFAGPYITWHLKTLHIEETYYLLVGSFAGLVRRSLKPMLWALLILGPFGRVALFVAGKNGIQQAIWLLDRYLPVEAFAIGGLLALDLETVKKSKIGRAIFRKPMAAFALAMLVLLEAAALRPVQPFSYALMFTWPLLFSLCSAVMILSGLKSDQFFFSAEWLRRLGVASYSVYLFQQFALGPWKENFGSQFRWAFWIGVCICTTILVPIWYRFVEKPLTDLGTKLFPRAAKPVSLPLRSQAYEVSSPVV